MFLSLRQSIGSCAGRSRSRYVVVSVVSIAAVLVLAGCGGQGSSGGSGGSTTQSVSTPVVTGSEGTVTVGQEENPFPAAELPDLCDLPVDAVKKAKLLPETRKEALDEHGNPDLPGQRRCIYKSVMRYAENPDTGYVSSIPAYVVSFTANTRSFAEYHDNISVVITREWEFRGRLIAMAPDEYAADRGHRYGNKCLFIWGTSFGAIDIDLGFLADRFGDKFDPCAMLEKELLPALFDHFPR